MSIRLISVVSWLFLVLQAAGAQDSIYYRANEWRNQLDQYYAADSIQFPEKGQVLFVGSSSIRMWKNIESCFPEHKILARGFGGSRMSDVLYHMQRLVIDYRPGQIILYCGENDLSNGVSPSELLLDIKTFVRILELQLPGVPVVLLTVKPSPLLYHIINKQAAFNQLLYEYSLTKKQVKYVDIVQLMMDKNGKPDEQLYLKDKLHINAQAYSRWAKAIQPHLIRQTNHQH